MKADGHTLHTIRAVVQQAYLKVRVYGCVVPHPFSRSNGASLISSIDMAHHVMHLITLENGIGIE